jgi:hypothetical protein
VQSIKLSITVRSALVKKYSAPALAGIDAAVAAWIQADAARAIRTVHLAIDDAAAMKPYKVAPLTGAVTPGKVKAVLDALVAQLAPEYIVLFGSDDIVPHFVVDNPSIDKKAGDDDKAVPTDNPYACSARFQRAKPASYLVPDRVVGRIPDVPNDSDPSWFERYLTQATPWRPRPKSTYTRGGLYVCTATWKKAGVQCVDALAAKKSELVIVPPAGRASAKVKAGQQGLRQMIKCHGADADSAFYGENTDHRVRDAFPEALRSPDLPGRVRRGAVIGAMCCYGANLFDPNKPAAEHRGEPPISSQYLRLGAYGFLGSSTIAWVGDTEMMCADWIVTSFLKSVTAGASLGRAALEAKQDFLRWLQQQGATPDVADEKTLIQFMLLGDPSIHPVLEAAAPAGPRPARAAVLRRNTLLVAPQQRQLRRTMRLQLGRILRQDLPTRTMSQAKPPRQAAAVARVLLASAPAAAAAGGVKRARWTERVSHPTPTGVPPMRPMAAALRRPAATRAPVASASTYQYYWVTRYQSNGIRRISLVTVQTDGRGQVLGQRLVVSS